MGNTLESFVAKLQAEGLEAGRREGELLTREAEAAAARILRVAEEQAQRITQAAAVEATRQRERVERELEMAVRDGLLVLRTGLNAMLDAVLREAVEAELSDSSIVSKLLTHVVRAYAEADAAGGHTIEIGVAPAMADALAGWSLGQVARRIGNGTCDVALKGTLQGVGFEYRVAHGGVEVTPDAAAELLKEWAGPRLRELLDRALADAAWEEHETPTALAAGVR
jgi:hypothetical protein